MMMMNIAIHPLHVLVFVLCINTSLSSASKHSNVLKCIEQEREALLVFRQVVANEYDQLDSWNKEVEEDCCKWEGVGCNNHTGHVTHLLLSSLISPPPPVFMNSSWISINLSLLDLPYLTYLDLSRNFLTGIPDFIGSLTNLVHLDLSHNEVWVIPSHNLAWLIPSQIGNLSNLQYLDLSFNNFFDLPIPQFIGSLNSLRYLDLSNTYFSGVIPHEFGNLSKLHHLDLGNTFLGYSSYPPLFSRGSFNWLFNLSSLTHIDLSGIEIASPSIWASFIEMIPSISFMQLEECNLSAPSTFSNFSSSVSTLHLAYNRINLSIFDWLSHLSGSLVELDLSNNMLEGKIPESLGYMTALTHLNLGRNRLTGPIPNSFARMTALSDLDLSTNQLNGVIPKSFGNSSGLQVVDFSSNNFTGNLEDFVFGPFPLLKILYISENQLTGSLPYITLHPNLIELKINSNQLNGYLPAVFKSNSALQVLQLSNNHIRGSLPDFTGFSSLVSLLLDNNEFIGSVPDFTGCSSLKELQLGENQLTEWETQSIGLLYNLQDLGLAMNSIHSTITEAHLSNLSSLVYMSASYNSMTFDFSSNWIPPFQLGDLSLATCKLGPKFPNWIQNQRGMTHLDISNSQISDTIPLWFWNLSSIQYLNLSSNNITGRFSSKLINIEEIDLSSNHFDGPLPPISTYCSKINLSQNKFSGTLLSFSVVEDLYISYLDISRNQLSGALPDNWRYFKNLVFLNLGYNNFSGRIPTSIGHLVYLRRLILRKNKLYGELPVSLRNCRSLGYADLGLNKLSGKIPSWIGEDQTQLYALILKSNRFHGSMPSKICHLSNLHFLDLSINRIYGTIPPCFGNLTAMIRKETDVVEHTYNKPYTGHGNISTGSAGSISSYFDNVVARWKGQEFEYGRNFAYLKMIDLSSNKLTGEIPIGMTRLLELKGLNLSGNRFVGKVPPEIGQLKELECLDLSTNKFAGEIPQSMSGLHFLAYLNLSDNNFSGRIPSSTQLQGFDISTYEGNTGLCGKPLLNICPGDEPADHLVQLSLDEHEVDEDETEYERWVYISAALGFSSSFWGFIGTLVLNRRWRCVYYLFLENLKEKIYVAMTVRIAKLQRKFE